MSWPEHVEGANIYTRDGISHVSVLVAIICTRGRVPFDTLSLFSTLYYSFLDFFQVNSSFQTVYIIKCKLVVE